MKKLLFLSCAIFITNFGPSAFAAPICSQQFGENGIGILDMPVSRQVQKKRSSKAKPGSQGTRGVSKRYRR